MEKIPDSHQAVHSADIQIPTCHSAVLDTLHDILCTKFKWIQAAFHFFLPPGGTKVSISAVDVSKEEALASVN